MSFRTGPDRSTDSLRVLAVINGLGAGGAERSLAEMISPLRGHGVEVTVAYLHRRREGVQSLLEDSGHDLRWLGGGNLLSWSRALRQLIRRLEPDVLHSTLYEATLVARMATIGRTIPLVTSLVNTNYDDSRRRSLGVAPWRIEVLRLLDRVSGRLATDHWHAISEAVADDAYRSLGVRPQELTVIPRGRSMDRLGQPSSARRDRVRRSLGISADAPVIICVGRQEKQKGHEYLVAALPDVFRSYPTARVLVVGRDGGATSRLQALVGELGLSREVLFVGHREDVGDLLAASDLFAFPSLWEGLGGALLEAMALGLPVVASDLPIMRETLPEDGALLVPPADPHQLAVAITGLVADPTRMEHMGATNQARFTDRFELDTVVSAMASMYRRVVGSDKPPSP